MSELITARAGLPPQAELERIVEILLASARRQGATQAEAAVSFGSGLSVGVRLGEVETLEYQRDRGVGVTVYFGQRKASASTADWRPEALEETVRAACAGARYTAEDPCSGLADPALLAREIPDLDLWHPWDIDAEAAIVLARDCEAAARALDARISNGDGASLGRHESLVVYGNSHGFVGGYPSSRHSLSCSVIAAEGGRMHRDYWYDVSRDARHLAAAEQIGRRAGERALRRLGGRRVKTCHAPVLFVPEIARSLFGHFLGAIRGGALYRKSSFLLDSIGQSIFPAQVQLHERPHLPGALGSAPFDNEGVATIDRELVRDGVLQEYLLDSYSARKLGLVSNGHAGGVHNVLVEPTASGGLEALLTRMGTGLLVTELMGQGVNPVTGDYSRGAGGFWVENGAIVHPVEEITIAGNLRTMFATLQAIGDDVDERGGIRCGSVLLDAMTIAGE